MTKHYKYGGSTIRRTELCPGSAKAAQEVGPVDAGAAADRGTRIHEKAAELWNAYGSHTPFKLITEEDCVAYKLIHALYLILDKHGFSDYSKVNIEKQYALKEVHPEAGGTADADASKAFGDLLVVDFKTGYLNVAAIDNLQLAFYACGVLQNLDPFTRASLNNVHMVILQAEQEEPYEVHVREWTLPASDLETIYAERFKRIITEAEAHPDKRTPGDHCQDYFCPVRGSCEARIQYLNEQAGGVLFQALEGESLRPPRGQRLADLLRIKPQLIDLLNAAEKESKDLLKQVPDAIPGWTIVETMSNREWSDPEKVRAKAKELGLKLDEYAPRELVGPAPFEKLCKKNKVECDLEALVQRRATGVKLKECASVESTGDKLFNAVNENNGVLTQ